MSVTTSSERLLPFGLKVVLIRGGHVRAMLADLDRLGAAHPENKVVRESFLDEKMESLRVNEVDLGASPLIGDDVLRESDSGVTLGSTSTLAAAITSVPSKPESGAYHRWLVWKV